MAVLFPHLSEPNKGQDALRNGPDSKSQNASVWDKHSATAPRSVLRTFAPGFLARQEARSKRKALQHQLKQVTRYLGTIANASHSSLPDDLGQPNPTSLNSTLRNILSQSDLTTGLKSSQGSAMIEMINSLQMAGQSTTKTLDTNARPTFWEQVWPKAAMYPLLFVIVARQVHKNKDALWLALQDAQETVKGFVTGWVIEPVTNIINTVRGKGGLSLTGQQSLASDLDSLERMVLDFDREVYKMDDAQLAQISSKVRDGDLSEVLKAWETDIKVS